MFSRLPRVLVASAAVVALCAPLGVPAYAAASKPAVTKKPTAADLRRKAVLDLYARQKDLQYRYLTNRTTTCWRQRCLDTGRQGSVVMVW